MPPPCQLAVARGSRPRRPGRRAGSGGRGPLQWIKNNFHEAGARDHGRPRRLPPPRAFRSSERRQAEKWAGENGSKPHQQPKPPGTATELSVMHSKVPQASSHPGSRPHSATRRFSAGRRGGQGWQKPTRWWTHAWCPRSAPSPRGWSGRCGPGGWGGGLRSGWPS